VSREDWQSQMPPCFSSSSKILSLSGNSVVELNANFSRKCEIPLGYATSYLDPESITTPTVQNCPNRFSDATCNPFFNVVICVMWCSSFSVAYTGVGRPGKGCVSGGCVDDLFSIGA